MSTQLSYMYKACYSIKKYYNFSEAEIDTSTPSVTDAGTSYLIIMFMGYFFNLHT